MKNRGPLSAFRIISFGLLLTAIILTAVELTRFSRVRANLPAGLKIAEVPVGGLTRQEAAGRDGLFMADGRQRGGVTQWPLSLTLPSSSLHWLFRVALLPTSTRAEYRHRNRASGCRD